jgi:bifunctional non-homologous end joining protein LigD
VEAARKIRQKRFVLDGEAVILGVDGIADFNALHSRQHDEEVQLCAFDILVEGGDDLRKLPLHLRKTSLQRLLARRPEGIFVNPFEQGEIGPELFRATCRMGPIAPQGECSCAPFAVPHIVKACSRKR